jgi:hypothetical protein
MFSRLALSFIYDRFMLAYRAAITASDAFPVVNLTHIQLA